VWVAIGVCYRTLPKSKASARKQFSNHPDRVTPRHMARCNHSARHEFKHHARSGATPRSRTRRGQGDAAMAYTTELPATTMRRS
jgi:hypothetical protein